jgi:hypothetical protein
MPSTTSSPPPPRDARHALPAAHVRLPVRSALAIGLGCGLLTSGGLTGPALAQEATAQLPDLEQNPIIRAHSLRR